MLSLVDLLLGFIPICFMMGIMPRQPTRRRSPIRAPGERQSWLSRRGTADDRGPRPGRSNDTTRNQEGGIANYWGKMVARRSRPEDQEQRTEHSSPLQRNHPGDRAKHPQQVAAEVTRSILERKQSKDAEASTSRKPEPQAPAGTQPKQHSKGDPGAKRSRQERRGNDPEAGTSANANRESTEPKETSRDRSSEPPRRGPLHEVRYVDTEIPFPEHFTFAGNTTRNVDNLRRMETWNEFGRWCNPGYVSRDRTTIITNTEADPLIFKVPGPIPEREIPTLLSVAPRPILPGQVHGRGKEELAKEPGSVQ
jgi:hypothetical protein